MNLVDKLTRVFIKIFGNNKKLIASGLKIEDTNGDNDNFNNILKGSVIADEEILLSNLESLSNNLREKIETLYFPEAGIGNQSLITK